MTLPLVLALGACASTHARVVLGPPESPPGLRDDLLDEGAPLAPLLDALARHAERLGSGRAPHTLRLGDRTISAEDYAAALRALVDEGRAAGTTEGFLQALDRRYTLVEARFDRPILVTAYYEPFIDGARAPTARLWQPLYRLPPDWKRGVPYLTRQRIDMEGALAGRGLELCYVDPIDALQIQIEGGGTVLLDDGTRLPLDHAGGNGQPPVSLARVLRAEIPGPVRGWPDVERYLRSLPPAAMRARLARNPRYAFFRPRTGLEGAATSLGLPAVDGRTIATDPGALPKGGLGLLVSRKPRCTPGDDAAGPSGWSALSRLVLDEDTGGAIVGARVDLFWGRGAEAGRSAGVMKEPGRLYYFVPRAVPASR